MPGADCPKGDVSTAARRPPPATLQVVAVVAAGGILGALARHGIATAWPTRDDGFPWATFVVNGTGCLAMGVVMAWLLGRKRSHPLMRPFLGPGVLGGYTTFSTYAVELDQLLRAGRPGTALAYLGGSVMIGLAATLVGWHLVRRRSKPEWRSDREAGASGAGQWSLRGDEGE